MTAHNIPRYPRFRGHNERGWLSASDALLMCFYMQQPHQRIAPAIVRALNLLLEKIQPYAFTRYVGDGQTEPLDAAAWARLCGDLLGPEEGGFLQLEDDNDAMGSLYVDYRGLPLPMPWPERKQDVSVLHICLPTRYLEERGPAHDRALALEVARELPLNSGYVDFALCESGWSVDSLALIEPRYPGVHFATGSATMRMNTWVDGIHWMNFLGQPVLGQVGGASGLREHLPFPEASVLEMSGDRVLATLSEAPEVGDLEAGHTLPRHRALARLLEPHLYHRERFLGRTRPEDFLRWERRFLDG